MSIRRLCFYLLLAILLISMTGIPTKSQYWSQNNNNDEFLISGRNVNMVEGDTLPDGDPWLQRQNEPSIAVSTRNTLHLLAAANDYRTVDVPFTEGPLPGTDSEVEISQSQGDAWIGIFKSFDGGESWKTELLDGYPQLTSSSSPLYGYQAAADPVVRAGTDGLFYVCGMVFQRDPVTKDIGDSAIFVARYIDNNNKEKGDTIGYLGTEIVFLGNPGQMFDKPWMAVDIPRNGGCGTVYVVSADFVGNKDQKAHGKILFSKSADCGQTWSDPLALTDAGSPYQGAAIAIDPEFGTIYVALRRFKQQKGKKKIIPDAIFAVKSTNFGQSFSNPVEVAELNPFDQPTMLTMFRTNCYPTMAVDDTGVVYLAWSQRQPDNKARIVISTSTNGIDWSGPTPVELTHPSHEGPSHPEGLVGHQFMPTMAYANGKLMLAWYDSRYDKAGNAGNGCWFEDYIMDNPGCDWRHTIDVRIAQTNPVTFPIFEPSIQVSRYIWVITPDNGSWSLVQGQWNPPNYPLFQGGTTPFHGDYIDITPSPAFIWDEMLGKWLFNTEPTDAPVFHVTWTDNRDVSPPWDVPYDWTDYTPPDYDHDDFSTEENPECGGKWRPGMRNQNVYTSKVSWGLEVGSTGNSKPVDILRAFIIEVNNTTDEVKSFRLVIGDPGPGGQASFLQFGEEGYSILELDVTIAPYSSISRPVFFQSSDPNSSLRVDVIEIYEPGGYPDPEGLTSFIILNPGDTEAVIEDPDGWVGPPVEDEEIYDPVIELSGVFDWSDAPEWLKELNPGIWSPGIWSPGIWSPSMYWNTIVVNPTWWTPGIWSPGIWSPGIWSPGIWSPGIWSPGIWSPGIWSGAVPDGTNLEGARVVDVVWTVINKGNTTSSYTFKTFAKAALPEGIYVQLLVYKTTYMQVTNGLDCVLRDAPQTELLANITNPGIWSPGIWSPGIWSTNMFNAAIENATFSVPPGEEVNVLLRLIEENPQVTKLTQNGESFDLLEFAGETGGGVTQQQINTSDAAAGIRIPRAAATKLLLGTAALPDGSVGIGYTGYVDAVGGDSNNYTYSLNSSELPPGLDLSTGYTPPYPYPRGIISGDPTTAGTYHFVVQVDDGISLPDNQAYKITIHTGAVPDTPTITTPSPLPNAIQGVYYGVGLTASGGQLPYIWTLEPGSSLPDDLSLDQGGAIIGKPEAPVDTYTFTVMVMDQYGKSATKQFSLEIRESTHTDVTISGMVYDTNNDPLNDVVIRGLPNTPITGAGDWADGYYEDSVPAGWEGTAEPFKIDHTFDPQTREYTYAMTIDPEGDAIPDQDYNPVPPPEPIINLTFEVQPSNTVAGQFIDPAVQVKAQDDFGAPLPGISITLDIDPTANPGNGTLSGGAAALTGQDGSALFFNLSIDRGGIGYALIASAGNYSGMSIASNDITSATSDSFNIEGFSYTDSVETGRSNHCATRLADGRVLITGGRGISAPLASAEIYDPASGEFSSTGNMNVAREDHTVTLLPDGTVLIVGGATGDLTAEIYIPDPDAANGTFSYTTGSPNRWRKNHTATHIPSINKVLITGGESSVGITDSSELYDPVEQTFVYTDSMDDPRFWHTATLLTDGKVLIAGGRVGVNDPTNKSEIYDPSTGVFSLTGNMNEERSLHTATLLFNGKVLITGGDYYNGGEITLQTVHTTAELYDPDNGTFADTSGYMHYYHANHPATLLDNGNVLISGGAWGGVSAEIYNVATDSFDLTGNMEVTREYFTLTLLPDGTVLAACGRYFIEGQRAVRDTAEIWYPMTILPTYTISGTILLGASGPGLDDVLMYGFPQFPVKTDASGFYTGTVPEGWSGTVTPTKPGYTFIDPSTYYPPQNAPNKTDYIAIYTAGPTVTNVSSTNENGTYGTGAEIDITVTFSEAITVTTAGTPYLELETGDTDRNATYTGGSGTATLTFLYEVQAGDSSADLDYKETTSLKLDGGDTIKDADGNDADLTLPAKGAEHSLGYNKALVIDANRPDLIIESLTISPSNPTAGDEVTFEAVVKNQGSVSAGSSHVEIMLGRMIPDVGWVYDISPPSYVVSALGPGESSDTVTRKMTLGVAGDYEVIATADINNVVDESDETNNDKTETFTVTPGTMIRLVVTLPDETFIAGTGNSGTVTDQTAGQLFNITSITATDDYYNIITSYTGPKTLTYTGPGNALDGTPPSYTTSVSFADGQATNLATTLYQAEIFTITVQDSGNYGFASSILAVNPASASTLEVTGITDPVAAGVASDVTVTAKDDFGNVDTNYTGTIHFIFSDSAAVLPGDYTFQSSDNGTNTFGVTLKTPGEQSVTATDTVTSSITGSQTGITVTAPTDILIITPAGEETWYIGRTYYIRWVAPAGTNNVQIQYSWNWDNCEGDPINCTTNITPDPYYVSASDGEFEWTVPTDNPALISSQAMIRIVDFNNTSIATLSELFIMEEAYTLATYVNWTAGGSITKNPDQFSYLLEVSVDVEAVPSGGSWTFSHWTGDVPSGQENDNPVTITMDSHKSLTAHFTMPIPEGEWVVRYNNDSYNDMDTAHAITVDPEGNVYVTGRSKDVGLVNTYYTIKYDTSGTKDWDARYSAPGAGGASPAAIVVDADGNVYVTGSADQGTDTDFTTIKYDSSGTLLWNTGGDGAVRYNGPGNNDDYARAIAVDGSGNVYVTGRSIGSGGNFDYTTIKYNPDGNALWNTSGDGAVRYDNNGYDDKAHAMAVDSSGVYVTGLSYSGAGLSSQDYATVKYDINTGIQQWASRYTGPEDDEDYAEEIGVDASGNVYVTGRSIGTGTAFDYATIKYTSAGAEEWVRRYNGTQSIGDTAKAMVVDSSGNVYVTGIGNFGPNQDFVTIKYDTGGNELWITSYDGPNNYDDPNDIAIDSSGNVYVTGESAGIGTITDYATVKYDSSGHEVWVKRYDGTGSAADYPTAIAVDTSGNVYVTGISPGSGTSLDYATIKYSPAGPVASELDLTGPSSVEAGVVSGAFTLTSQDSLGNPANVPQNTLFDLTSSSGTATFYSDDGGSSTITQAKISTSTSSATFYYKDTAVGNPEVTAEWESGGTTDLGSASHVISVTAPVPAPEIWRSPEAMTFIAEEGGANPSSQTLEVKNSGGGTLSYTITEDSGGWLSVSPGSGTSTGDPASTHTVSVNISGLSVTSSPYTATITITAPGASNTPQTVSVTLYIISIMLDESNADKWFGGDNRDLPDSAKNVGVGQSIILPGCYINSVGFKFMLRFDYYPDGHEGQGHEVTLKLNVRSSDGTILKTVDKVVPAEYNGGWIDFDIGESYPAGEYIFTCYLVDGEINHYWTPVLGHTDNTKLPNSDGYSGGIVPHLGHENIEDWARWTQHAWDFNFRIVF